MKVALLHLDLIGGPEETNIRVLSESVKLAAEEGADWIITPETALQGYFFALKEEAPQIPVQPGPSVEVFCELAWQYGVTIFLGCAEQDEKTGKCYNSCLVINHQGEILGRHRKMHSHGGSSEAWASHGENLEYITCREMKAGILICADSWFMEHSQDLKDQGAHVIMIPAAWPPAGECGPGDCWERCSKVSGLPVWVCNQTGNHEILDMTKAESAVVFNGEKLFVYSGMDPAVLLFHWDYETQSTESKEFTVLSI